MQIQRKGGESRSYTPDSDPGRFLLAKIEEARQSGKYAKLEGVMWDETTFALDMIIEGPRSEEVYDGLALGMHFRLEDLIKIGTAPTPIEVNIVGGYVR